MAFLPILLLILAASTSHAKSIGNYSIEHAIGALSKHHVHLMPILWRATDLTRVFSCENHLTLLVPDDKAVTQVEDFLQTLSEVELVALLKLHAIPYYLDDPVAYSNSNVSDELLRTLAGPSIDVTMDVVGANAELVYKKWPLVVYKTGMMMVPIALNKSIIAIGTPVGPAAPELAPAPVPGTPAPAYGPASPKLAPAPVPGTPAPAYGPAPPELAPAGTPAPAQGPAVVNPSAVPSVPGSPDWTRGTAHGPEVFATPPPTKPASAPAPSGATRIMSAFATFVVAFAVLLSS